MNRHWTHFVLISLILLCACENAPEREIIENWSPSQAKVVGYFVTENEVRWKQKEEKFYEDGTQEYAGTFDKEGNRDGEWRFYYPTGQLWSLGSYKNGLKEGKKEVYWPDGMKRYEGQYTNDEKTGVWHFYNKDGSILQKMDFSAATKSSKEN
jgi:antitoxin component YwqK of YwqJK toxin-antitoxin module